MRTLDCQEGAWFRVEPEQGPSVHEAFRRARATLKPRLASITESDGRFKISGLIGTFQLDPVTLLQVAPKVKHGEDWIHAVLDLLVGTDRVDAAGERAAGLSPRRRDLLDALAGIYDARLSQALRRDGPIQLMRRETATLPMLKGRLRTAEWLRQALWAPHRFPVEYGALTVDHDISRGLAQVAEALSSATSSSQVRGRLLRSARAVRPGLPDAPPVSANVSAQRLPPQWAAYAPAWSVASALIAQRSLLGARGRESGVSVVVEAWPLLERLLERSLSAAVREARSGGHELKSSVQDQRVLLSGPTGTAVGERNVRPDGLIRSGGHVVASFEAKYKRRRDDKEWPPREDYFQAVATAAAWGARLAVLVYPDEFEPAWWTVEGFGGEPARLVAVGLGLFSYRAGSGDAQRGTRLVELLGEAGLLNVAPAARP